MAEENASPPAETPPPLETWHAGLPEDLRDNPSLVDFKDETEMVSMPINVARSYVSTKKLVGRDKIPMPTTEEEWSDTYNRLGRPEAASQYDIEIDPNADAKVREALSNDVEWFKNAAHKAGLNARQTTALFSEYANRSSEAYATVNSNNENTMQESEAELRTLYGNNFEGKMVLMNRGLSELDQRIGGGLTDMIKATDLQSSPAFVKSMVMVGEMMAEDLGLDKMTGGPAVSAGDLDEQIATILTSDAYGNAQDPGHDVAVEKAAKLMQMKHGKTAVDTLTRTSFIT